MLHRTPLLPLLISDRRGTTLSEYSIIAAVVMGVVAGPMVGVGDAVSGLFGQEPIVAVGGQQAATPSGELDDTPIAPPDSAGKRKIQDIDVEATNEEVREATAASREAAKKAAKRASRKAAGSGQS